MNLKDELPDNPLAAIVEDAVDQANRQGDTSDENISRLVAIALKADANLGARPESLFDERKSLSRIRDFARQRMVSPEAVLIKVLMRANVGVSAHVMIPPMIGTAKPLNMAVVGVGPSGTGKTSSDDVAEDYWPLPHVPTWPLGTAEGTCQAFDPDEDGQPQETNIIFSSSEIDNWAALGERAGSLTFPVLRQIITGDQIGQKNASKAHTRVVNKRSYRAGLSLSAQPGGKGATILFADAPGGFPQRCLFGSEVDPGAPDDIPTGITPLWPQEKPDFTPNAGNYYEIPFPESVVNEIRTHRRKVLRGDPTIDPLDGHRNLTKAKVAAGLMILDGRNKVSEDDWRIAERIMQLSDRTRRGLADAARMAAAAANRARGHAIADRDEVVADRKMQRAKQAITRWLGKHPVMAGADLRQKLKADIRDYFESAAAELADGGVIHEIEVKNGAHYQMSPQGTGVPEVHPTKLQVSEGVPRGTGGPPATVTNLDSRRSHEAEGRKVSCQKWMNHHIAELRAAGHTTATSFAVYQAGQAAGYTKASLSQAASAHPDIVVIKRSSRGATWSLTGDHSNAYVPAGEFFSNYLDELPDDVVEVDQDDYRQASTEAGYSWEAALRAATQHPRIESVPAHGNAINDRIWRIKPESDEVTA